MTDGEGVDADYKDQFTALATRGTTFGENANGYATKMTNPEGEVTISVQDGLGRTYAADKNVKSDTNPSGIVTKLGFNVTYINIDGNPCISLVIN